MTADRPNSISNLTTRQKITAVVLVLVVIFLIWQIYGLFGGGSAKAPAPTVGHVPALSATAPQGASRSMPAPRQTISPSKAMTPEEASLLKLQQETEAKYIQALNELQMLKIERDIAETNKAIMAAKLDTITAEKNIVDLLKPPAPPSIPPASYAPGLVNPIAARPPIVEAQTEVNYSVISVSQLLNRWHAVLGYQGSLYNVMVGDILPADNSKVIFIDKTGVILEKNGMRKKISMVPII